MYILYPPNLYSQFCILLFKKGPLKRINFKARKIRIHPWVSTIYLILQTDQWVSVALPKFASLDLNSDIWMYKSIFFPLLQNAPLDGGRKVKRHQLLSGKIIPGTWMKRRQSQVIRIQAVVAWVTGGKRWKGSSLRTNNDDADFLFSQLCLVLGEQLH